MLPRIDRLLVAAILLAGCSDDDTPDRTFLDGTESDPGIAISVGSIGTTLLMLQTGNPDQRVEIPLGTSSDITAVGFSVRNRMAAVPLGNTASVALVNLETATIEGYFTFPSGNATGSAWVDDETVIACNQLADLCGRFTTTQAGDAMDLTEALAPFPTAVVASAGRVFVVSANLDDSYMPAGPGVVSELDPASLDVVRTFTVGTNPQYGGIGSDGRLYVVNSGDWGMANGSVSIINLGSNVVEEEVTGFGDFPGPVAFDSDGRLAVSSFSFGSVVWDAQTGTFVRGADNPVCAPAASGCRAASDGAFAPNGRFYQSFFGSAAASQPAYYFVYDGSTFALQDSIPVPLGPAGLQVLDFSHD